MRLGPDRPRGLRTGRHYVGFDIDPDYVALGERRIAAEVAGAGKPAR